MNFNLHVYSQGLATAATVCLCYLMRLFQFNILYSTQENEKMTMGKPVIGNFFTQSHCSLWGGFTFTFLLCILLMNNTGRSPSNPWIKRCQPLVWILVSISKGTNQKFWFINAISLHLMTFRLSTKETELTYLYLPWDHSLLGLPVLLYFPWVLEHL